MTFAATRAKRVSESKLLVYKTSPELEALYADKSYAIADGFIPLVPRHMSTKNWCDLFWHQPTLVVIRGRRYPDLCCLCANALGCVRKHAAFKCKVTAKRLMLEEPP